MASWETAARHDPQHLQGTEGAAKGKVRVLPLWGQIPLRISPPRWLVMVKVKGTPSV